MRKSFGAVQALEDVDFQLYAGEIVALVGDNGAGKSTLVKILAGVHPPDSGSIFLDGAEVMIRSPADANRLGIATVYQDLALCDNLDVVQNLFLGQETVTQHSIIPTLAEIEMERRTHDVLQALDVTTISDLRAPVGALSGGQRQAVAISRAVMREPNIVLLDEPTAALGVAQTRHVLDMVARLASRGLGVVVISHNLQEVFGVAKRIVVLRLGRVAAVFERDATTPDGVVAAITGSKGAVK